MEPTQVPDLDQSKQVARGAILDASEAAEQFRQDFKVFLSQVIRPDTWKDGLKLLMDGGLGLLKDLQEMITDHSWTPDKLVARLDKDLESIVEKNPEFKQEWENVKVSFHFAKMKTDEALAHVKEIAKREYGKFDQGQVVHAVWSGVKEEMKLDLSKLLGHFKKSEPQ